MNSTTRFSGRVDNYVKYRPHYPKEIISFLEKETGLTKAWTVADIGSGTGISAELFLQHGNRVYGVEPNKEMREKAEELYHGFPGFISIDGTAEATKLEKESIDLIVAGQAFHWFDRAKAKTEFRRIARAGVWTALLWNERQTRSEFEKGFEELVVKHAIDYTAVDHRNITDREIGSFFDPNPFQFQKFYNEQTFDPTGLKGRLMSSSYVPTEQQPGYKEMIDGLDRLFEKHQTNGKVKFEYETKLYLGKIK
jgi:SAM-dependent methyltransferase